MMNFNLVYCQMRCLRFWADASTMSQEQLDQAISQQAGSEAAILALTPPPKQVGLQGCTLLTESLDLRPAHLLTMDAYVESKAVTSLQLQAALLMQALEMPDKMSTSMTLFS